MADEFTISLERVRLSGFHGLFEQEALVGNEFELDIHLCYPAPAALVRDLRETIDYGQLFSITKSVFTEREALLETVAQKLAEALHGEYPQVTSLTIAIRKYTAPIPGITGAAGVRLQRVFR
jgi:dihydroneopterin aldolase